MKLGVDTTAEPLDADIARVGHLVAEHGARRVVVSTRDDRAFNLLAIGALRAGCTLVPVAPRVELPEGLRFGDPPVPPGAFRVEPPSGGGLMARLLGRKNAVADSFPAVLRDRPQVAAVPTDDTAVALELDGSSWTHGALRSALAALAQRNGVDAGSRILNLAPNGSVEGLFFGSLLAEATGASLYRVPHTTTDVRAAVNLLYRSRCTHLFLPPAPAALMTRTGEDLRPLFAEADFRALVCTGVLDADTRRGITTVTGRPVLSAWGHPRCGVVLHGDADGRFTPTVDTRWVAGALEVAAPDGWVPTDLMGSADPLVLSPRSALTVVEAERPEARVVAVATAVFQVPVGTLSLASAAEQVPGWDSMGQLRLVEALEAAFSVKLGMHEIMQIRSLADALRVVQAHG